MEEEKKEAAWMPRQGGIMTCKGSAFMVKTSLGRNRFVIQFVGKVTDGMRISPPAIAKKKKKGK